MSKSGKMMKLSRKGLKKLLFFTFKKLLKPGGLPKGEKTKIKLEKKSEKVTLPPPPKNFPVTPL